jgi:hypothetical protein
MSCLSIKVDVCAGTEIKTACADICAFAKNMGIMIKSNFNGINVIATPGSDPAEMTKEYYEELCSSREYKYISGRRG